MSSLVKRIQYLNAAFNHFKEGLALLKIHSYKTPDVDTHIWRIENALETAEKAILQEMQNQIVREVTDEEFNKIIKKFKRCP